MQRSISIKRLRLPAWAHGAMRAAVDFAYPPVCRLCECELPEATRPKTPLVFCTGCTEALTASHGPACIRCGASIGPGLDPQLPCAFCHDERFAFERVFRLGVYDGALRTACLEIKQAGAEPLAAAL